MERGREINTGWWFGTCFIFPYIGNNHPNWLIFFRGVAQHQPEYYFTHWNSRLWFHQTSSKNLWVGQLPFVYLSTWWGPLKQCWDKSVSIAHIIDSCHQLNLIYDTSRVHICTSLSVLHTYIYNLDTYIYIYIYIWCIYRYIALYIYIIRTVCGCLYERFHDRLDPHGHGEKLTRVFTKSLGSSCPRMMSTHGSTWDGQRQLGRAAKCETWCLTIRDRLHKSDAQAKQSTSTAQNALVFVDVCSAWLKSISYQVLETGDELLGCSCSHPWCLSLLSPGRFLKRSGELFRNSGC